MKDFQFLQNPVSKKWVIQALRRAKRPDVARLDSAKRAKGIEPVCPFCPGREDQEQEVYRVPSSVIASDPPAGGERGNLLGAQGIASSPSASLRIPRNDDSDWQVRVLNNKFPFAPVHEVIIHSPDHHKNFGELSLEHVQLIIQTFRQRYQTHQEKGLVYIFHNRGEGGGESLPHPHSQLAVIPFEVKIDIPRLDSVIASDPPAGGERGNPISTQDDILATNHFSILCPHTSQWPDEVWIAPKKRGRAFGEITDDEIVDLSDVLTRLIHIMDLRHGNEFPYNFYMYPGGDWYVRLIPRSKVPGGFELGTGIFVNTQDPMETIAFIKEHFQNPDEEKIKAEHQARYERRV